MIAGVDLKPKMGKISICQIRRNEGGLAGPRRRCPDPGDGFFVGSIERSK
jgi:hypothetical protein